MRQEEEEGGVKKKGAGCGSLPCGWVAGRECVIMMRWSDGWGGER